MDKVKEWGLANFGATGRYTVKNVASGEVVRVVTLDTRLSQLPKVKRWEGLGKGESPSFDIEVYVGDKVVGFVDSDRQLHLTTGTLRQALGWAVVTGIDEVPPSYDLDVEVLRLTNVIKRLAPRLSTLDYDTWSETWMEALKKSLEYKWGSRFADGYCGFANTLWKVGVQDVLGKTHNGFVFAH